MSEMVIRTGAMLDFASVEQDCARQLAMYMDEISRVKSNLGFKVKSRASIDSQLQTMINVSDRNIGRLNKLSTTLSEAAGTYSDTEKRVTDNPQATSIFGPSAIASGVAISSRVKAVGKASIKDIGLVAAAPVGAATAKADWLDGLLGVGAKTIGKLGAVGGAGNLFYDLTHIDSTNPGKSYANIIKDVFGIVGGVAKTAGKGAEALWKDYVFGFSSSTYSGFGDAIKSKLGDFKFGEGFSSKLSATCKWAGAAFTVAAEGFDNFKEFGGNLSGRFFAETAVESGVSIFGPIVGAGAVAGGATLFGLTAPAWLATAGGVVLYAGGNWIVKNATGKDIGEWASDTICDVSESIGKGVKQASKSVGKWFNGMSKTVKSWF